MKILIALLLTLALAGCDSDSPTRPAPTPPPEPVDRCEAGGIPHPDYGCPPYGEPEPDPDPVPAPDPIPGPDPAPAPQMPPICETVPKTPLGMPCTDDWYGPWNPLCQEWRQTCEAFYPDA